MEDHTVYLSNKFQDKINKHTLIIVKILLEIIVSVETMVMTYTHKILYQL